jgi:hypothetical protein
MAKVSEDSGQMYTGAGQSCQTGSFSADPSQWRRGFFLPVTPRCGNAYAAAYLLQVCICPDFRVSSVSNVHFGMSRLRAWNEITVTLCISSFGHLRPGLNHKILDVALLRLRFCSIGPAKSDPNLSAFL